MPLLMPRFTVSLSDAGVPSVLGISLESVGRLLRQDVSGLKVDPATVQMLKDAGIQNFEAVATAEGLYLYVNGQPVPYLALDEETRENVGDLLKLAGVQDGTSNLVQNLLNNNILSRVGVPVVIKLPVDAGVGEAGLRELEDPAAGGHGPGPVQRRRKGVDPSPGRGPGRTGGADYRGNIDDRLPGRSR